MAAICTHKELTADFAERCNEVNEALEETYTRLEELEDSNKILRSFAAFEAGFLAARMAIAVMRLAFGLDKTESNWSLASLSYKRMGHGRRGPVDQS